MNVVGSTTHPFHIRRLEAHDVCAEVSEELREVGQTDPTPKFEYADSFETLHGTPSEHPGNRLHCALPTLSTRSDPIRAAKGSRKVGI